MLSWLLLGQARVGLEDSYHFFRGGLGALTVVDGSLFQLELLRLELFRLEEKQVDINGDGYHSNAQCRIDANVEYLRLLPEGIGRDQKTGHEYPGKPQHGIHGTALFDAGNSVSRTAYGLVREIAEDKHPSLLLMAAGYHASGGGDNGGGGYDGLCKMGSVLWGAC